MLDLQYNYNIKLNPQFVFIRIVKLEDENSVLLYPPHQKKQTSSWKITN